MCTSESVRTVCKRENLAVTRTEYFIPWLATFSLNTLPLDKMNLHLFYSVEEYLEYSFNYESLLLYRDQ